MTKIVAYQLNCERRLLKVCKLGNGIECAVAVPAHSSRSSTDWFRQNDRARMMGADAVKA
jgi:hypothetical protein